jgi:hypothetical protein
VKVTVRFVEARGVERRDWIFDIRPADMELFWTEYVKTWIV